MQFQGTPHWQFEKSPHHQRVIASPPLVLDTKFFGMVGVWSVFPAGIDVTRSNAVGGYMTIGDDSANPTFITTRYLTAHDTWNKPNGSYTYTTEYDRVNGAANETNDFDGGFDYGDVGDYVDFEATSETSCQYNYENGERVIWFEDPFTLSEAVDENHSRLTSVMPNPSIDQDITAYGWGTGTLDYLRFVWGQSYNAGAGKYPQIWLIPRSTMYPWDGTYWAYQQDNEAVGVYMYASKGWPTYWAVPSAFNDILLAGDGHYYARIKYQSGSTYHMVNILSNVTAWKLPNGMNCTDGDIDDIQVSVYGSTTGQVDNPPTCGSLELSAGIYEFKASGVVPISPGASIISGDGIVPKYGLSHSGSLAPTTDCCP